jgi:hypothetical protein
MSADSPPPDAAETALRRAAQLLFERAGLPADCLLERVRGGGNNRVFRVTPPQGPARLLKAYFQSPSDPRNRFEHEHAFYELIRQAGIRRVPEPLGWDAGGRLGLFEWIDGEKLAPEEVNEEHVRTCARFFVELNAARASGSAANVLEASESCFRLADHLLTIETRVQRLAALENHAETPVEFQSFIHAKLLPAWREIRRKLAAHASVEEAIAPNLRCLSPSDFGFHNVLRSARGLLFFDFEYAGWDDPAKMVCDFFCQPEIPAPGETLRAFVEATCLPGWNAESYADRVFALLPAYRVKWVCIILNVFLKDASRRRAFANEDLLSADALALQLRKAQTQLDALALR